MSDYISYLSYEQHIKGGKLVPSSKVFGLGKYDFKRIILVMKMILV